MNAVHSYQLTVRFSCYSRELHNILYAEGIPERIWLEERAGGSRRLYKPTVGGEVGKYPERNVRVYALFRSLGNATIF
jgi:hypothetical protein